MVTVCNVCNVKTARYYRRTSGERLCESCLESSLEKAIRKHLRQWKVLRPSSRVLIPIYAHLAIHSTVLATLIVKSKRGHDSHVYVALFDNPEDEEISSKIVERLTTLLARYERWSLLSIRLSPPLKSLSTDLFETLRLSRHAAVRVSRELKASFVLFPLTRTLVLLLVGEALIRRSCDNLLEVMSEHRANEITIVNALYPLEEEAVVSYAYLLGLLEEFDIPGFGHLVLSKTLAEALRGGPDLEFSYNNVYTKIAKICVSRLGYNHFCSFCGAPSDKEICEVCSKADFSLHIEKIY
ncbi:MAG: hypothetical protein QXS13_03775 [Acidilobaceae archaeon]